MVLVALADIRDIVVIVYGAMGIFLMLALVIAALGIWFAVRKLTRMVTDLIEDPIRPALQEFQKTAQNVRGTSEFVADSAVHPVIRAIAVGRGVRRGVGAVTGLRKRGSKSSK